MIARLKLKPGQKGTKALVEKYGDALVCVRYRYCEASRTRIKTVELIVEKKELPPPKQKFSDESLVQVQIAYGEAALGKMGGKGILVSSCGIFRTGRSRGRSLKRI